MSKRKPSQRSNNSSGYIGVALKPNKRYRSIIYYAMGKVKTIGTFATAIQAAEAYDKAAVEAGKPLSKINFPDKVPPGYTPKNGGLHSTNTSGYRGVSKKTKYGYKASAQIKGIVTHLGFFNTSKQAAIAYDYAIHKHGQPTKLLNFATMKHDLTLPPKRKKGRISSTGIRFIYKKRGKFNAYIKMDGKDKYLGSFATLKEAVAAYNRAAVQLLNPTKTKEKKEKKESSEIKKKLKKNVVEQKKKEEAAKKKKKKTTKKRKMNAEQTTEKTQKTKKRRVRGLMELAANTKFSDNMFNHRQ